MNEAQAEIKIQKIESQGPPASGVTEVVELLLGDKKEFDRISLNILGDFFLNFEFFKNIPFKTQDTKQQEARYLIENSAKYIRYKHLNSGDILTDRGKKNDCVFLVMKGKLGVYLPKTPQELNEEILQLKKEKKSPLPSPSQLSSKSSEFFSKPVPQKQQYQYQSNYKMGNLAADSIDKYLIKSNVLKVKLTNIITPGQHVCEKVLQGQTISDNTIAAQEETHLAVLSSHDYKKALNDLTKFHRLRLKLLQHNFPNADEALLSKLAMYFVERNFDANSTIYNEGSAAGDLYCVVSGEVKLIQKRLKKRLVGRKMAENPIEQEFQIEMFKMGDVFGEEPLFNEQNRLYSAVAMYAGTSVICLPAECVEKAKKHYPQILDKLKKFMILKREVRHKRMDPLLKNTTRDIYLHLSDFSKEMSSSPGLALNLAKLQEATSPLGHNAEFRKNRIVLDKENKTKDVNNGAISERQNSQILSNHPPLTNSPRMPQTTRARDPFQNQFFRFTPTAQDRFIMSSTPNVRQRSLPHDNRKASFHDTQRQDNSDEYCMLPSPGAQKNSQFSTTSLNQFRISSLKNASQQNKNNLISPPKSARSLKNEPNTFSFNNQSKVSANSSASEYQQNYTIKDQCVNLNKLSKQISDLSLTINNQVREIKEHVQDWNSHFPNSKTPNKSQDNNETIFFPANSHIEEMPNDLSMRSERSDTTMTNNNNNILNRSLKETRPLTNMLPHALADALLGNKSFRSQLSDVNTDLNEVSPRGRLDSYKTNKKLNILGDANSFA